MFPFKKKTVETPPPVRPKIDHKKAVRDVIIASKEKLASMESIVTTEEANLKSLQDKESTLLARAGELEIAISHGTKVLELGNGNSVLENHVTVAKRELSTNKEDLTTVQNDIQRAMDFLSSISEKVQTLKDRIEGLESELADLSLRDLEVSITSELSDTSNSIRNYRQEVFTREAKASFND